MLIAICIDLFSGSMPKGQKWLSKPPGDNRVFFKGNKIKDTLSYSGRVVLSMRTLKNRYAMRTCG